MTTLSRLEAATIIARRLSDGKNGMPAKFTARAWQGTDGDPPPVRVYVDSTKRKALGYVAILSDGTASFDRITAQAGAIKRLVGKALHGVDVMPDELVTTDVAPSVVFLWEGITNTMNVPVRVVVDDGNDCVMTRADNGEWVLTDDDVLTLDALWSAVHALSKGGTR